MAKDGYIDVDINKIISNATLAAAGVAPKNDFTATEAPTSLGADDGYAAGSMVILPSTGAIYICVDADTPTWKLVTTS